MGTIDRRTKVLQTGLRMIPLLAPLTLLAPFGGQLVGAVGPRLPSGGLLLSAVGMLLLSRIGAHTGYGTIWPLLLLTGMGLAPATPRWSRRPRAQSRAGGPGWPRRSITLPGKGPGRSG